MDEPKPTPTPTFSTLTEIMEHFHAVPYAQFQQDLQAWFDAGLKAQGMTDGDPAKGGIPGLNELVSHIYNRAELQQTLSDHHITDSHDDY